MSSLHFHDDLRGLCGRQVISVAGRGDFDLKGIGGFLVQ